MNVSFLKNGKKFAQLYLGIGVGAVATIAIFVGFFTFGNEGKGNSDSVSDIQNSNNGNRTQSASTPNQNSKILDIADLDEFDSEFARNHALHELLVNAKKPQLLQFIEQSQEISSQSRRNATQRAVFQRFAALNPRDALKNLEKLAANRHDDLTSTIYGEWALGELDTAIAHALSNTSTNRQAAMRGILTARDDLSETIRRGIAKQFGEEQFAAELAWSSEDSLSFDDPSAAWNQLVNDNHDDVSQTGLLIRIAEKWYSQNGLASLDEIAQSLSDRVVREAVMGSIIYRAMQEDPHATLDQALSLSGNQSQWILRNIARHWARMDPENALLAVASVASTRNRALLQETVVRTWANHDPYTVLDTLELLPDNLRTMGEEQSQYAIARIAPEDAVRFLTQQSTSKQEVMGLALEIAAHWPVQDPTAAIEWALSDQFADASFQHEVLASRIEKPSS